MIREIDCQVAERVMGWVVDPIGRVYAGGDRPSMHCSDEGTPDRRWEPSVNIAQAWEVLAAMVASGRRDAYATIWQDKTNDLWTCELGRGPRFIATSTTASEAICLAALEWTAE